jgi:dipeptidyl aminopeptidase/acylaminoacyl peptidase
MTFDQIDRLVRQTNPVPDPAALDTVDAPVLLLNSDRSIDMDTQDRIEEPQARERQRPRWIVTVAASLAAIVSLVVMIVSTQGDRAVDPAESATIPTVATTAPPPTTNASTGLELVDLGGSSSHLSLPPDAWMADLSMDGETIAFLTKSIDVGFCGGCADNAVRLAIVPVGADSGGFVYLATENEISIAQPAWSPDGNRLAFQSESNGNVDIYVADLTGTLEEGLGYFDVPVIRLTTDPGIDEFPAWSSDGSVIYYDNLGSDIPRSGMTPTAEIWSVPSTGGDPTRLTDNDISEMQPDVGPDGTVAYWRNGDIYAMNPDGSEQRRLATGTDGGNWNPRWSPDGAQLAVLYVSQESEWNGPRTVSHPIGGTGLPILDVAVVDLETGDWKRLGASVASFYSPVSWTLDGTALLVNRNG